MAIKQREMPISPPLFAISRVAHLAAAHLAAARFSGRFSSESQRRVPGGNWQLLGHTPPLRHAAGNSPVFPAHSSNPTPEYANTGTAMRRSPISHYERAARMHSTEQTRATALRPPCSTPHSSAFCLTASITSLSQAVRRVSTSCHFVDTRTIRFGTRADCFAMAPR